MGLSVMMLGPQKDSIGRRLYDEAGGERGIQQLSTVFFEMVREDRRIAPYFDRVDLVDKFAMMLGYLLGGIRLKFIDVDDSPMTWSDFLARVHAPYNITDEHYDLFSGHLLAALIEGGFPARVTKAVAATLIATEPQIVRTRVLAQRIDDRQVFQDALELIARIAERERRETVPVGARHRADP